jgi:hypothetical protein
MPPTTGTRTSTRQGRATIRPTNYYARTFAGRLAASGLEQTPESNSAPGFLPTLTHFTGAVDAFPKEIIKHFSMFKEVEAKLHDPEQLLKELLDEIALQPVATKAQLPATAHYAARADLSASVSSADCVPQGHELTTYSLPTPLSTNKLQSRSGSSSSDSA